MKNKLFISFLLIISSLTLQASNESDKPHNKNDISLDAQRKERINRLRNKEKNNSNKTQKNPNLPPLAKTNINKSGPLQINTTEKLKQKKKMEQADMKKNEQDQADMKKKKKKKVDMNMMFLLSDVGQRSLERQERYMKFIQNQNKKLQEEGKELDKEKARLKEELMKQTKERLQRIAKQKEEALNEELDKKRIEKEKEMEQELDRKMKELEEKKQELARKMKELEEKRIEEEKKMEQDAVPQYSDPDSDDSQEPTPPPSDHIEHSSFHNPPSEGKPDSHYTRDNTNLYVFLLLSAAFTGCIPFMQSHTKKNKAKA